MRFLRLLFWLFLALLAALFLGRNWTDVTVDLWGNMQADVKLPLLLIVAFMLGWLPASLLWRSRLWRMKRAQAIAAAAPPPLTLVNDAPEPVA